MKIRNAEDLAQHMGARDASEKSLSHRLYKGTNCGASLSLVTFRRLHARKEKWQVRATRDVFNEKLVRFAVRRGGKGAWLTVAGIPQHVLDYLCARANGTMLLGTDEAFLTWPDFVAAISREPSCTLYGRRTDYSLVLGFWLTLDRVTWTSHPGVRIDSIVEGVDQCASGEKLAFPFSSRNFDAAVQRVEDEVTEIWNATHGCEGCARLYELDPEHPDTENGYVPVHPDCTDCNGTGTII